MESPTRKSNPGKSLPGGSSPGKAEPVGDRWRGLGRLVALPVLDVLRGQRLCLAAPRDLAWLMVGLLAGWWVYVPLHELLHALACLATGGTVSRLEVSPLYGGSLLARFVPWVVSGGEYAGRLSGFDTGGSDLVYLATDLGPFLLTLFPGVWALRRAARARRPLAFGAALPLALAPVLSLTGDAYEIASILTTRLPRWAPQASLLRGDDVAVVVSRLRAATEPPWGGLILAVALGLLWAVATYGLGAAAARALGQPALDEPGLESDDAAPSQPAPLLPA